MDTSEKYILMCEKAQEIQELKNVPMIGGNFYFNKNSCQIRVDKEGFLSEFSKNKDSVWLPRQDQLQEMCFYENRDTLFILQVQDFYCFFFKQLSLAIHNGSMERACLLWVMETKFNKKWNHKEQSWEEIK